MFFLLISISSLGLTNFSQSCVPIGTHDWEKFVKPSELIDISKKNNLSLKKLDGMNFNILDNSWKVTNDTSVNYITKFIKN